MTFSSVAEKLAISERLFCQLRTHFSCCCRHREIAVVETFKQEVMYGLSTRTKESGHCREVAVSTGSTVFWSYKLLILNLAKEAKILKKKLVSTI